MTTPIKMPTAYDLYPLGPKPRSDWRKFALTCLKGAWTLLKLLLMIFKIMLTLVLALLAIGSLFAPAAKGGELVDVIAWMWGWEPAPDEPAEPRPLIGSVDSGHAPVDRLPVTRMIGE